MPRKTKKQSHRPMLERLHHIGQRRVAHAIRAIELCGNLAAYKPSPKQIDAIGKALQLAIDKALIKLRGEPMFTLPTA